VGFLDGGGLEVFVLVEERFFARYLPGLRAGKEILGGCAFEKVCFYCGGGFLQGCALMGGE